MNGQGTSSLVSAMEKDLPHLAQRVGEEGSSITSSGIADLCQTGTTGMNSEQIGEAVERALAAIDRNLTEWQTTADESRLELVRAHINHLSRLARIHHRSQA